MDKSDILKTFIEVKTQWEASIFGSPSREIRGATIDSSRAVDELLPGEAGVLPRPESLRALESLRARADMDSGSVDSFSSPNEGMAAPSSGASATEISSSFPTVAAAPTGIKRTVTQRLGAQIEELSEKLESFTTTTTTSTANATCTEVAASVINILRRHLLPPGPPPPSPSPPVSSPDGKNAPKLTLTVDDPVTPQPVQGEPPDPSSTSGTSDPGLAGLRFLLKPMLWKPTLLAMETKRMHFLDCDEFVCLCEIVADIIRRKPNESREEQIRRDDQMMQAFYLVDPLGGETISKHTLMGCASDPELLAAIAAQCPYMRSVAIANVWTQSFYARFMNHRLNSDVTVRRY